MPASFQRIVVAVDGSTHATDAVAVTAALDWQPDATTISVTGVVDVPAPRQPPSLGSGAANWERILRQQAATIVASASRIAGTGRTRAISVAAGKEIRP